jgi:hypothetical protein
MRIAAIIVMVGSVTPALAQSASRCEPAASMAQPVRDSIGDFKNLRSRETVGWLSLGAAAAFAAHGADSDVTRTLSRSQPLHHTLGAGAFIGGPPLQLGVAMATYSIGHAFHLPCVVSVGADLVGAQLLSQALTFGMKQSFRRARPEGMGFSFPSGHTTASFATATVLQRYFGWKVGIPAYAVASYVAASRVQNRRHYLSDVAFGAALGMVAGRTATIGSTHRVQLAPIATAGGGGVGVTW